jgi:hypothetical protein
MSQASTTRAGLAALLLAIIVFGLLLLHRGDGGIAGSETRLTSGKSGITDAGPASAAADPAGGVGKAGAEPAETVLADPQADGTGKSGVHL